MIKTITLQEYFTRYKELRDSQLTEIKFYIPQKVKTELVRMAHKCGMSLGSFLSHLLTQVAIQYDEDALILPVVRVVVDEDK